MACQNCNNPTPITPVPTPDCPIGCSATCCSTTDSTCVVYTGPNLTCIGAATNTCLELIIQLIDSKLCAINGDYSGFNLGCLRTDYTINTEQQFAEAISDFACLLRADYDNFVNNDFQTVINNLQTQINSINNPGITSCPVVGITASDNLFNVLNKLTIAECATKAAILDISTANWSQCYTTLIPPTTLKDAFNVVIDQICLTKSSAGGVLPTFDNTGTCLSSPTTTDSLVDTIIKIRSRLCLTPTFAASNLGTHDCVSFSNTASLETVLTNTLSTIDNISKNSVRSVSSEFIISDIDPLQPCLGKEISLNPAIVDRNVALDTADLNPGTLIDKIVAGSNVTLDFGITNPGQLTISSAAGAVADEKVKINAGDPTAGFLQSKIIGANTTFVNTSITTASPTQLQISSTLNLALLIDEILDMIADDEDLKNKFCNLVASCPSPCDAPSNIVVTYTP